MKNILLLAVCLAALTLGACAHQDTAATTSTTTHSATRGYSK